MAAAYENEDFVLSAEHAEHINERHVDTDIKLRSTKSLTWPQPGNRETTLSSSKAVSRRVMASILCMSFKWKKVIGTCPWGFPTKEICIYYSHNPKIANKFRIISTYPFSWGITTFWNSESLGFQHIKPYIGATINEKVIANFTTILMKTRNTWIEEPREALGWVAHQKQGMEGLQRIRVTRITEIEPILLWSKEIGPQSPRCPKGKNWYGWKWMTAE